MAKKQRRTKATKGEDELEVLVRRLQQSTDPDDDSVGEAFLECVRNAERAVKEYLVTAGSRVLTQEGLADVISNVDLALFAPSVLWLLDSLRRAGGQVDSPRLSLLPKRNGDGSLSIALVNLGTKSTTSAQVLKARRPSGALPEEKRRSPAPGISLPARRKPEEEARLLRGVLAAIGRDPSALSARRVAQENAEVVYHYVTLRRRVERASRSEVASEIGLSGAEALKKRMDRKKKKGTKD
jgi:hypothetical protein